LLEVVRQIAGFELLPAADQHIAQPARLDLGVKRVGGDAQRPANLGLRDHQPAIGERGDALPDIGVDLGCGGSHR